MRVDLNGVIASVADASEEVSNLINQMQLASNDGMGTWSVQDHWTIFQTEEAFTVKLGTGQCINYGEIAGALSIWHDFDMAGIATSPGQVSTKWGQQPERIASRLSLILDV